MNRKISSDLYSTSIINEFGKKIIFTKVLSDLSLKMGQVQSLVKETAIKDRRIKTQWFYVPFESEIHHQMMELGAKVYGVELHASVDLGLNYLNQFEFDTSIKMQNLSKSWIGEAVLVMTKAHKSSKTSVAKNYPRDLFRVLCESFVSKKKKIIVAKEDSKIIGLVSLSIKNNEGHILDVCVLPSEQGRGISKLLYYEAMKYFKRKKVLNYTGVTSTVEVLGMAKKMKRKQKFIFLELKN